MDDPLNVPVVNAGSVPAPVVTQPVPVIAPVLPQAIVNVPVTPTTSVPVMTSIPSLTALQHVEAWWQEMKDTTPRSDHKAFWVHAEENWAKLVNRLKGL